MANNEKEITNRVFINNVYPSEVESFSVEDDEIYGGAHKYTFKNCLGFSEGETKYENTEQTIQFVKKEGDTIIPGLQNEQLILAIRDRINKMNDIYPSKFNKIQIEALDMFLMACELRIDDRIERGVMGELKK